MKEFEFPTYLETISIKNFSGGMDMEYFRNNVPCSEGEYNQLKLCSNYKVVCVDFNDSFYQDTTILKDYAVFLWNLYMKARYPIVINDMREIEEILK